MTATTDEKKPAGKKPAKKPAKKGKAGSKKKVPGGVKAFTEGGSLPRWLILARVGTILGMAAAVPTVLGVPFGRQLFWAAAIAILPLFWVLGGYHLWRRLCPLAIFAQLGRLAGRAGTRRASGWLADNYPLLQFGILLSALSLRLIMTNGTPWALAGFLVAATLAAAAIGFFYTGKTWCNYFCPVGIVEKMYTEPSRLGGLKNSQCSPCTACKKNCPDIDLEQGYWKECMLPARRTVYFAWPGVVFAFYFYYYLVRGNWDYYFTGEWTREDQQIQWWLEPGFHHLDWLPIPIVVAAPLTLLAFGALSYGVFRLVEAYFLGSEPSEEETERARHRTLVLAGFIAFIIFYFYGGQPTIRMAPAWFGTVLSVVVAVSASAIFFRRWARTEADFVKERFAEKLLKRWEWDDQPEADRPQDLVLLHEERTRERKERMKAYKDTVREMVADGIVTSSEMNILDSLRAQLGISDKEHKKIMGELSDEERQLFDPEYQGSVELRIQQQAYQRELEQELRSCAHDGEIADEAVLERIRLEHGVGDGDHRAAIRDLLSAEGAIMSEYRAELEELDRLVSAWEEARQPKDGHASASLAFMRHLCRWRGRQRTERALNLLTPVIGEVIPERVRQRLVTGPASLRADAVTDLETAAGKERVADLLAIWERFHADTEVAEEPHTPAALLQVAGDRSPYLRATAVHLLTRYDDDEARRAAEAAIDDESPMVREAAYYALGVRQLLNHDHIAKGLADPDKRVRAAAVYARSAASQTPGRPPTASGDVYATLDARSKLEKLTSLEKMMLLHSVPIFQTLDPDDLELCAPLAEERSIGPERDICREGEEGEEIFLIISGEVEVWTGTEDDKTVIGHTGPGGCIGEMAVLDSSPRSANVTATKLTRALVLPGDEFRSLILARPAMGQAIISVLVGRMRDMIASASAH